MTEFNYRYADPAEAHVFVGVEVRDRDETAKLLGELAAPRHPDARPLRQRDGEAPRAPPGRRPAPRRNEVLYRFEFPERPGALMRFLDSIGVRLEHQPVPLPQPRRRLRPRARRAFRCRPRGEGASAASCASGLSVRGRDAQPRLPALSEPGRLRVMPRERRRVEARARRTGGRWAGGRPGPPLRRCRGHRRRRSTRARPPASRRCRPRRRRAAGRSNS